MYIWSTINAETEAKAEKALDNRREKCTSTGYDGQVPRNGQCWIWYTIWQFFSTPKVGASKCNII
jgi:hypothetical protein